VISGKRFFPKQRGRCRGPGGFQWPHAVLDRGVPPIFEHPYRRFATWPSNSLDKTAIQFLILDRGVDFWGPKSIIFECMQQNLYFFTKLRNVSWKITKNSQKQPNLSPTPIFDHFLHFFVNCHQIRGP